MTINIKHESNKKKHFCMESKFSILKKHYREYFKDSFPKERLDDVVEQAMCIKEETAAIMKAMEEYAALKAQPGPVWVKCSDRLPGHKKRVKWRDGNDHYNATKGEISLSEMEKPNLEGWEWLDESAATFNPELFQIISDAEQSKEEDLKAVKEVIGGAAVKIDREWVNNALVEFALAYHRTINKDIANDAAEYLNDKLNEAGVIYVLSEDESAAGREEDAGLRETIENIILSAGKHNQEQCSEIADAILRDLSIGLHYQKKKSPSVEREEDACDLAEWMRLNCKSSQNGWVDALGKWDTTKGWYELFKQQKEK